MFCWAKDNKSKSDLHSKFKKYHNLILTLSIKSKDSYFKSFFKEHKKMVYNMARNKSIGQDKTNRKTTT